MTSDPSTVTEILTGGSIEILGQIVESSNAIFLVEVTAASAPPLRAVYKPVRGERPLHDFPVGITRREVAAFALSTTLGWDLVPETVWVEGPFGEGSLQRFVDADFDEHYFTLVASGDDDMLDQLRRICCFDLVANNTDRKGGHCLVDADRHVWAIDNALCFHVVPKLRTVIWDFAGEPIPRRLREDLHRFATRPLPESLTEMLHASECDALVQRCALVADMERFPHDPTGSAHPWPLL